MLYAEGTAEFLHLGSKTALGVLSSTGVMLSEVGTCGGEGMFRTGSNKTDALDQGLTLTKVLSSCLSGDDDEDKERPLLW